MSTRHPLAKAFERLAILAVLGLTLVAMLLWTLEESRVRDGDSALIVSTAVRGAGALLDLIPQDIGADGTPELPAGVTAAIHSIAHQSGEVLGVTPQRHTEDVVRGLYDWAPVVYLRPGDVAA